MAMSPTLLCNRLRRTFVVWLAVLVAVIGSLAVPMSHALARGDLIGLMEVCTTVAADTIPADSPAGQESTPFLAHCPFCLQPTNSFAPPPSLSVHLSQASGGQQVATVWQVVFFSVHFAYAPPPRGPPRFS